MISCFILSTKELIVKKHLRSWSGFVKEKCKNDGVMEKADYPIKLSPHVK